MLFRYITVPALAVALWAGVCHGAVRWCKSYDEALDLAKQTGRPIVVAFILKGDTRVKALRRTFGNARLARYGRVFLFCYVELELVNNTVRSALLGKFKHQGAIKFPTFYFIDAREAVLAKTDDKKASNLDYFLKFALRKHGPVADPRKLRDALRMLKQADALYEQGKYGGAASLYRRIVALNVKAPPVEAAKGKLAKIEAMANEQLEAARTDLKDKAYAEAVPKLAALERDFAAVKAGQEARKELARLRKLAEAKDAFAALEARAADTQPQEADTGPPTEAEAEWKIDGFTDEELDALDAMAQPEGEAPEPPPTQSADAARKARRLLALARNWIANNRPDKARPILRKLIQEYPKTLQADQAKVLLSKLE